MTLFEGICIGFLAGVVASLLCFLLGGLIDGHFNNNDCGGSDLPVGDRDRSGNNGIHNREGGE